MDKNMRTFIIVFAVIVVLVVGLLIYSDATADERHIKWKIDYTLENISDYRNGEDYYMSLYFSDEELEDPVFIDFLAEQSSEMFKNGEYTLLNEFLGELEYNDFKNTEVLDTITTLYEGLDDLETAFQIKEKLKYLEYYNSSFNFNHTSGLIATYIKTNGTKELTTTSGEGFYSDKEDSYSKHVVGLPNSPLYDAKRETYLGDFVIVEEFGVRLNSNYKETSYHSEYYIFRGNSIDFSPYSGECIYSGDYLFCFSYNGNLIGFEKID